MKRKTLFLSSLVALMALPAAVFLAQTVSSINYDAVDFLKPPANLPVGEVAGVASNSKGHVFIYTRTGTIAATVGTARTFAHGGSSRILEFDQNGKFVQEIGEGLYPLVYAQSVRIDRQDNIWVVDQYSNMVVKFDPEGRVVLTFGRKPETARIPAAPAAGRGGGGGAGAGAGAGRGGGEVPAIAGAPAGRGGGAGDGRGAAPQAAGGARGGRGGPGAGTAGDSFNRPTDVALDAAGNIFVADGLGNSRVLKMDKNGRFVKTFGSTGTETGQFNQLASIAVDARGDIYVADKGNKRIQVFDNDGNFKTQYANVGAPSALCISPGAHQYLFSSNSNDPDNLENGEIYKMELDGKIVGKFGSAGHLVKEFGSVNSIDCPSENTLFVGELINWRVQKVTLRSR
jgi:6-bladed beta-propeller